MLNRRRSEGYTKLLSKRRKYNCMFFGLVAIEDHPCCKMQKAVEAFFLASIDKQEFSVDLFPDWFRSTIRVTPSSRSSGSRSASLNVQRRTLGDKFCEVHTHLHSSTMNSKTRKAIYEEVRSTNQIKSLCDGSEKIAKSVIEWDSVLGKAIAELMFSLYESLDLAVFRKPGQTGLPTHQFYRAFIKKNRNVCPFCGLDKFKNWRGPRRQDFDHYLYKSDYPLAAANMQNLVPTCSICNQDYKGPKDILANGTAFYPYGQIPEVKLEICCEVYPETSELDDRGKWKVTLEVVKADAATTPKMKAWDRVYKIKQRLVDEIEDSFEEWMEQVWDNHSKPLNETEFKALIMAASQAAKRRAARRREPKQIIKQAFYDFMATKAETTFVESFRISQNKAAEAA